MTVICFFYRENVEALIKDLNAQRNSIKKHGITVDGRHLKIKFTGDYAYNLPYSDFV